MTTSEQGLCLNCAHIEDCALKPAKRAARGIQFCEEYEMVLLAAAGPASERSSERVIPQCHAEIPGLCGNCANYPGCTYPKPEAGVWHCEDYL